MSVTKEIEPSRIRPLRGMLVVRRYERPERWGGLVLPGSYQRDRSGKLWELAREHRDVLGTARLAAGTILEVRLSAPGDPGATPTPYEDEHGRALWVLDAERVYGVIPVETVNADEGE